jgi:signal transduction histidine kinase
MDTGVTREADEDVRNRAIRARGSADGTTRPAVRSRWKFLADASELLDSSLDYQATLKNVLRLAVPAIADYAAIGLLASDGSLNWGWSSHRDPAKTGLAERLRQYRPDVKTPGVPAAETLRAKRPLLFDVVDETLLRAIARDETHLLLLRELSPTSYITIPLHVRDRLLGLLVFATTVSSSRRFTGRDLGLAYQVGRRAALAVDHAVVFQQAQQAARARDVMMAVVSHDLKNPLSTISMAVNFLLEDVIPDDTSHHMERQQLGAVQRAAERAFRLIRDLLDVTAIEAGQLSVGHRQHHPVASVLEEAADMLGPLAAAKRINLLVEMQKELPMISADRDRLLQVFSNLGGNAIKFTPELGRVTIGARPAAGVLEFSVADTGPGIADTDLPHVFDRFWRATKTAHIGTGLGLAIAKGIVEAHGGQISVSSIVGSGTEFIFSVPVAIAE